MSDQPKDEAFGKWWASSASCGMHGRPEAHRAWNAAWTCAKLGQLDRAKSEVRSELQQKLLAIAVECFKERDHTGARFYLDLADEKHSIWQ